MGPHSRDWESREKEKKRAETQASSADWLKEVNEH